MLVRKKKFNIIYQFYQFLLIDIFTNRGVLKIIVYDFYFNKLVDITVTEL